jgi:hypothetical protein
MAQLMDVLTTPTGYLDPVDKPIDDVIKRLQVRGYEVPVLHRARREISRILAMELKPEVWMDKRCFARVRSAVGQLDQSIAKTLAQRG